MLGTLQCRSWCRSGRLRCALQVEYGLSCEIVMDQRQPVGANLLGETKTGVPACIFSVAPPYGGWKLFTSLLPRDLSP